MEVFSVKIPDINLAKYNPRKITDKEFSGLKESIKKFGFVEPIIINKRSDILVGGHQRLKAAESLGMKEVPVVYVDLSESEEIALNIALNSHTIAGKFDNEILHALLDDLRDTEEFELLNFDVLEKDLGLDALVESVEGLTDEDAVPEIKPDPITKRGDVWLLGNHRVMCGDSTMIDDVEKLMQGEKADMGFTDPPYNTGMTAQSQAGCGGLRKGKTKGRLSHMFNDSYTDEEWEKFMHDFCSVYYSQLKDNTGIYICLDWRRNHELIPHIKNNGFQLSNVIVWDKVVHGLGSDYKYTYELLNVCKKGKPEMDTHQGDREYSDVWHIQRKMGKNKEHATAKPIELVERGLRHTSKPNALVIDYFLGSGSTLIACEKNNRKCYGMELDEKYCDVIVKRWQEFTGKEATLESTGENYNDLKKE